MADDTLISFRDPLIGTRVDEYDVQAVIGQGAMGIVYRGLHNVIGKPAAIKVLKPDYANDPEMVQRLVREARTVNAIRHPGIVDVFGFGTLQRTGQPYIVMDLLEGEPLDVFIRRQAPLKPKAAWPILDDVLAALGAAHSVGVIHRDVKPGNIFLESHPDARSRVKVIDFGLARQADRSGGSIRPTSPGSLIGTPAFMAPEQVVGQRVTPATDLYAVGGVAYQMLTGHLPYEAPSAIEVISLKMAQDPVRPKRWASNLDSELEDFILLLLQRDLEKRPQTADEARKTLRRLVEGRTAMQTPLPKKPATSKTPLHVPKPAAPPPKRDWGEARTQLAEAITSLPAAPKAGGGHSGASPGPGLQDDDGKRDAPTDNFRQYEAKTMMMPAESGAPGPTALPVGKAPTHRAVERVERPATTSSDKLREAETVPIPKLPDPVPARAPAPSVGDQTLTGRDPQAPITDSNNMDPSESELFVVQRSKTPLVVAVVIVAAVLGAVLYAMFSK